MKTENKTNLQKRIDFILRAKMNKSINDKHLSLKKEIFEDLDGEKIKAIYQGGAIEDVFTLNLMRYADEYVEYLIQSGILSSPDIDLRDRIAMEAMNGQLCAQSKWFGTWKNKDVAKRAYAIADAMIQARKQ